MFFIKILHVLLLSNYFWLPSDCARILAVFPTPAKSHQMIFRTIVNELLQRGHHITMLSPDPIDTANPNITQIDWSYTYNIINTEWNVAQTRENNMGFVEFANKLFKTGHMLMEAQMKHPEVLALVNSNQHFDLVFVEYVGVTPILAFGEHFQAPVIGITSFDTSANGHAAVGNVFNPVAHPEVILPFGKDLTFIQRVISVFVQIFLTYIRYPYEYAKFDKLTQQVFGSNVSNSFDLMNSIDMLMTYGNPSLGYIRPTVPATVTLHSVHIQPPQPLPYDIQSFLDASTKGCIYVSFGTIVKSATFSKKTLDVFINTFRSLNYNILWKWESETMENKPDNVKILPWLPQQDVLAHPNVKLFISQGGPHSIEEAIDRHVPMIAIPFITDQFRNSLLIQEKKIGRTLDLTKLTAQQLLMAIHDVISDRSYKRNIIKIDEIAKDQPMKSLDKAVWWIEYVIRHQGAKELRYHGIDIPFYQYHFFDIIGVFIISLLLLVISFFYLLKLLRRNCSFSSTEEKIKLH